MRDLLREVLTDNMLDNQPLNTDGKPAVILVIGVNGVGKTTSIGKLAARYVNEGKKVMLSAADTFRAAAADQLEIWAKRAGADIVRHGEGADPAAVVFDSISAAKARGSDIIIVDTAGRLHNKANLMNELAKIDRGFLPVVETSSFAFSSLIAAPLTASAVKFDKNYCLSDESAASAGRNG